MKKPITRRRALALAVGQAGAAPGGASRVRLAPRDQLVSVPEFEEQALRALSPATASLIADRVDKSGERADRQDFDRITLRPRMCVPTLDLDLTVTLFGDALFAPVIVGPMADQKRFHPDGEAATVRGASQANAPMIVSSHSSVPLASLVKVATTPVWAQVFASDSAAKREIEAAGSVGCRAICLTVGVRPRPGGTSASVTPVRTDWTAVGALVAGSRLPVIVKGVTTPAEAKLALQQGAKGIIVSSYGGVASATRASGALILQLAAIVDAVAGQAPGLPVLPVLVDGGFRRGTDIVKALAFGAQAVVVGRPVMWGLAAYGAEGVRSVVEMLQTETARYMAMCGKSRVEMLTREIVRVHAATPASTSND